MTKNCKTLFFGDVQVYLGVLAQEHDSSAWLLDQHNYKSFINGTNHTVYTSLGDLPKNLIVVLDILKSADVVVYCPPEQWSDNKTLDITDPTNSIQGLTETLLLLVCEHVTVHGLDNILALTNDPIALVAERKTENQQLWVAGCSMSHGIGVDDNERYGELLSQELDMPVSFLTRQGAAIDWAADQILRSDIRSGDIVVWGITECCRLTHVHQNQLLTGVTLSIYTIFPEYHQIVPVDNLFSQQTFYKHLYSIQQVINYCKKINAKLFLVGLLHSNYSLLKFLRTQKNYIHIPYTLTSDNCDLLTKFIDLGSDLEHPGPKQHQAYKNIILNFINS